MFRLLVFPVSTFHLDSRVLHVGESACPGALTFDVPTRDEEKHHADVRPQHGLDVGGVDGLEREKIDERGLEQKENKFGSLTLSSATMRARRPSTFEKVDLTRLMLRLAASIGAMWMRCSSLSVSFLFDPSRHGFTRDLNELK